MNNMKKFKKSALKLACLLVGLNTFTACYGPAPYPEEPPQQPEEQLSAVTDADSSEELETDEESMLPQPHFQ